MKKSKKIFLALAFVFLLAMLLLGIDISRKTTFPGAKPQLKERLLNPENTKNNNNTDTEQDSLRAK